MLSRYAFCAGAAFLFFRYSQTITAAASTAPTIFSQKIAELINITPAANSSSLVTTFSFCSIQPETAMERMMQPRKAVTTAKTIPPTGPISKRLG